MYDTNKLPGRGCCRRCCGSPLSPLRSIGRAIDINTNEDDLVICIMDYVRPAPGEGGWGVLAAELAAIHCARNRYQHQRIHLDDLRSGLFAGSPGRGERCVGHWARCDPSRTRSISTPTKTIWWSTSWAICGQLRENGIVSFIAFARVLQNT